MIPEEFVRAWRRNGLVVANGTESEPAEVWWLQARHAFADVRVPIAIDEATYGGESLATADSFAGFTTYDPPELTWHRQLDLHGNPVHDAGIVTWEGADLMEAGEFGFGGGAKVPYVERWQPVPGTERGPLLAAVSIEGPPSVMVRCGQCAVVVVDATSFDGGYAAAAMTLRDGVWTVVASLDDTIALPTPPTGTPAVGDAIDLDGRSWMVQESELRL